MTIYQTISEDRELWGEEALKVGENEDRFIWEFEKALFSRWRELDEILTGQRKGPYEIPRAETLALKSFRNWRRGMYWREPHAQISGPREAKTLMTEETLRLSAEIVALVSIPRTGALFETFLKSKEEERKLIDHW
ncbi:MAG: hypothetical protein KDN19_23320 [Verrucomicrobiae bacterium]|nr:hypothetical protein [Verrucomicrobiae bacterium]